MRLNQKVCKRTTFKPFFTFDDTILEVDNSVSYIRNTEQMEIEIKAGNYRLAMLYDKNGILFTVFCP